MEVLIRILRSLWFVAKAAVFLVGIAVIALIVAVVVAAPWEREAPTLAEGSVLQLAWEGRLDEKPRVDRFIPAFVDQRLSLTRLVRVIDRAAVDPRIAGLELDLTTADVPYAHAEAIAAAVQRFREAGKTAHVFAEAYDLPRYSLATAFDQIWMPPSGEFAAAGVALETPYAGEFVDDLGVRPALERRKLYKTAADVLMERHMHPAVRQAMAELVDDVYDRTLRAIAERRKIPGGDAAGALDRAFWDPQAAVESGLVDRLAYRHDMQDALKGPRIAANNYFAIAEQAPEGARARVALVVASGEIASGWGGPLDTGRIASGSLVSELEMAARDPSIDAILLRLDSPGGGYAASDAIREAISRIEKPVIVSMGNVAASGGYMIAIAADRIVAHGSTLTGSIGVIGGKIVVDDLLRDNGINWELVQSEPKAGVQSPFVDYTFEQRQRLAGRIDRVYESFVRSVAEARQMSPQAVEAAAQGRVWTGRQALERGLIDRVGGLDVALDEVAGALAVDDRRSLDVVEYPPWTPWQRLSELVERGYIAAVGALGGGSRLDVEQVMAEGRAFLEDQQGIRLVAPRLELR